MQTSEWSSSSAGVAATFVPPAAGESPQESHVGPPGAAKTMPTSAARPGG
jgi:hypothetical protein